MNVEQIKDLNNAQPFRPFTIHSADGCDVTVHHPEFIALAPSGKSMVVYQPDDSFRIIDVRLATALGVTSPEN